MRALKMSAVDCVPRIAVNARKQFWNENLDKLKQISIDMHALWRTCGSPRSGVINAARLRAKFDFKSAVKKAERDFDRTHYDELNELFINKDTNNFWKSWSAKFSKKSSSTTMIDGNSNDQKIADKFADHFCSLFVDSSNDVNAVNNYKHIASERSNETVLNSYSDVDLELVESCISALKPCKAAGHDGIAPEHLLFSHPCLVTHLKLLFALMFKHEYVPEAFGEGIIIPIVKDKNGDLKSSENYRPITLSSMISKVFELYLLEKFSNYLDTDSLQFGFKKKLGCRNALFALRCVLQYYNQRGSNVYIASLDATKAFDRVNHYTMFTILYRRGLPAVFVNLLINWYNKLSAQVRWNGLMSRVFCVKSGVRQGGILSPSSFNVYVNSIVVTLRLNGLGCYIKKCYVGCLMYADDLLLMSASVVQLQRMLDVCGRIGNDLGIV